MFLTSDCCSLSLLSFSSFPDLITLSHRPVEAQLTEARDNGLSHLTQHQLLLRRCRVAGSFEPLPALRCMLHSAAQTVGPTASCVHSGGLGGVLHNAMDLTIE